MTFTDYIRIENGDANRLDQLTAETIRFIEEVESVCEAPVSRITTGFNSRRMQLSPTGPNIAMPVLGAGYDGPNDPGSP